MQITAVTVMDPTELEPVFRVTSQPDISAESFHKHFKLPCLEVEHRCDCGHLNVLDGYGRSLCEPFGRGDETLHYECPECERNWELRFEVEIAIRMTPLGTACDPEETTCERDDLEIVEGALEEILALAVDRNSEVVMEGDARAAVEAFARLRARRAAR